MKEAGIAATLILITFFSCMDVSNGAERSDSGILERIAEAGGVEDYPESNYVVIYERNETEFDATGAFESINHRVVKILTEKGLKDLATATYPYHAGYMSVDIETARVIHPDGEITEAPEDAIKDGTMSLTQQMNIFEEDFRQKTVTYPSLKVGDTIEAKTHYKADPIVRGHYNGLVLLQEFAPIIEKEVIIRGPEDKPLEVYIEDAEAEYSEKNADGKTEYYWRVSNVPQIVEEFGMTSLVDIAGKLMVGTFKDWKELSVYGASLNEGKIDITPEMREKVEELTKDYVSLKEKIMSIYNYVSTKVRYMGSSMDVGAFMEPHKASYTFEKQFGVCRDKTILMISMLREIGVECDDVIININYKTEPAIPSIYFQHAICGVKYEGRTVYMDPTLELSAAFGEPYVGDRYVLHLTEPGSDLKKLPPTPASRSLGFITAETVLSEEGGLSGSIEIKGRGFYEYVLRMLGRQLPGFQFLMLWQKIAQDFHKGTSIANTDAGSPSDLLEPYVITFEFEAPEYIVDIGEYQFLKFALGGFDFDVVQSGRFEYLSGLKERRHPLFVFTPNGSVQEETLIIPDDYEIVAVPDSFDMEAGPVSLKIDVTEEGQKIIFRSDFRLNANLLEPEEYLQFREAHKRLKLFQKSMIILKRRQDG